MFGAILSMIQINNHENVLFLSDPSSLFSGTSSSDNPLISNPVSRILNSLNKLHVFESHSECVCPE